MSRLELLTRRRSPSVARRIGYALAAILALVLCPASALAGSMQWQLLDAGDPLEGDGSRLVHMQVSNRTVLMYGDQFMVPMQWTLNGDRWTRDLFSTSFTPVYKPAVAYDSRRNVLVHFGGFDRNYLPIAETWEFNGSVWTKRTDVGAPPARGRAAMAFDSARGVMVLFGGNVPPGELGDTWEYDGVLWRQVNPPVPRPSARFDHSMAYDSVRARVVMAFGRNTSFPAMNETWVYDGTRWTKAAPQPSLLPRLESAMTYDPLRQAVYAFGGSGLGDTLRWTGTNWQTISVPVAPPARFAHTMTFDNGRGSILLFGGEGATGDTLGDLWKFNGVLWEEVPRTIPVPHRYYSGAAFDSKLGKAIAYGGFKCCSDPRYYEDSWIWDGRQWNEVTPIGSPGFREDHAMVFDPSIARSVVFGGANGFSGAVLSDTWLYDMTAQEWTQVLPSVRPAARTGVSAVYDEKRGGVLIFGGYDDVNQFRNDTWLFRGGNWSEVVTIGRPSKRRLFGFAYDAWRDQTLLYGGWVDAMSNGETWILNGSEWTQALVTGPGKRHSPVMAFDPLRGRTVLIGGNFRDTADEFTWEFDGTAWNSVATVYSPDMNRRNANAVWDSVHHVVLLTAGAPATGPNAYNDSWAYGWDADDDLKVGGFDNCPNVSNSNQQDSDADTAGDVCDCAPSDSGSRVIPSEVTGLMAAGDLATSVTWDDLAGTVGSGVRYDVLSGTLSLLQSGTPFGDASCIANGRTPNSYLDSRPLPSPGNGQWYLVRAKNVCGVGTLGPGRFALEGSAVCPP